jgi:integrase
MPKHFRAILDPKELGGLLRAVDDYRGTPEVRAAVRLAPLLFVRPGELRRAEWVEVDFEAATWSIPALKTKTREPHIVPLCAQAGDILRDLHALTGRGRFLFPSMRNVGGPMSANAINAALGRLGYGAELVAHSFRATARTLLDEALGFPPHLIEHQLAHAVRDPLGRAYNRTAHLAERRRMMQAWADYLDGLKGGAEVVTLHGWSEGRARP